MLFIGVSGEERSKIQEVFVDKLGAKYPILQIDKSAVKEWGIKFYPSYYCLAPDGTVFSIPDDRCPSTSDIEKLLKDVTYAPKSLPHDSRYSPVRKLWDKQNYGKLGEYLGKMLQADGLDPEMKTVFEAQQAELDKRAGRAQKRVEKLAGGPDYYAAETELEAIEKEWKGFPAAEAAATQLANFGKDPKIKNEVKAGAALAKLMTKYDIARISQRKKLMKALPKFIKKWDGTHAAAKAARLRSAK